MYRATHIYILFAASVNLLVAHGLNNFENYLAKIQLFASALLLLAPVLVFIAYVIEPPSYLIERPVSYWGIVFLFTGVVLVSLLNLPWAKRQAT